MNNMHLMRVDEQDQQVIGIWVREHAENTARYYRADAQEFLTYAQKPIREVTLPDIRGYEDSLTGLKEGSKARKINGLHPTT